MKKKGYLKTNHQFYLFLEKVLSVLEGAKLELFFLMLQLLLGGSEVKNEVLKREHYCVHWQRWRVC